MSIKPNGRGLINQTEDRMKRLKEPRDKGFIYQVEFDAQLERILGSGEWSAKKTDKGFKCNMSSADKERGYSLKLIYPRTAGN